MDSLQKYTNLSEYAEELTESFLASIEQQKKLNLNQNQSKLPFDISLLDVYNPQILMEDFSKQTDSTMVDLFYEHHPELSNGSLLEVNPLHFLNAVFDFAALSHENQE